LRPLSRTAERIRVRGRVQGVGFRPHLARLAHDLGLEGWARNDGRGAVAHVEGDPESIEAFARRVLDDAPPAAVVESVTRERVGVEERVGFEIVTSDDGGSPTVQVPPDLATCDACLSDLRDPDSRFRGYPFLNCTQCGPRYSVLEGLPYDRAQTTLAPWPMCPACAREYADPLDRRFHAQPTACPRCGPSVRLVVEDVEVAAGHAAIEQVSRLLRNGSIVAVKGTGGYLLACDARHELALEALRSRKGRREKPFALMARDLEAARSVATVDLEAAELLTSPAAPVVLLPSTGALPDPVAPGLIEVGVMLPNAPVHHLLFDAGAPDVVVMTSGNRSSEPMAFHDADALERLSGLADAVLVGDRPVARRIDDSVVRPTPHGPLFLRRARGYAPGPVARLPTSRPVLALGADLKSAPLLAVDGQAFLAPYVGDLGYYEAEVALRASVRHLLATYGLGVEDVLVAHDAHPGYRSTALARDLEEEGAETVAVQHHRAHVASVLAERGAWDTPVVGLALDGLGWGDDETAWGGEVFAGSLRDGLDRVAHLSPGWLPGGDAAARWPVQAAAGFLHGVPGLPDLEAEPFGFPSRYRRALALVEAGVQTTRTTSMGRLFDAAAALCGFTREQTYEGQAAAWLEGLARSSGPVEPYPFPNLEGGPLLSAVAADRRSGRPVAEVAQAFHLGLAAGLAESVRRQAVEAVAVAAAGGVFLNAVLVEAVRERLERVPLWLPHRVPAGDGGLALGQAALALRSIAGLA
jgi:hydrogenase maturation protein HypF